MNTLMDDWFTLKINGKFVDYMVHTDPGEYTKHVRIENGKKVLYLRVPKAIYRFIKSGLLWHKLFYETLQKHRFVLNSYDLCVANKIIGEK